MEISEERGVSNLPERKMYEEMCQKFAVFVQNIIEIFPALEASQPQKSGMLALCELHWAVDRAKSFLQRIVNSSTLYLAITSDSVDSKFEKVKGCLDKSLRRLESNVSQDLAQQISVLVNQLQGITFESNAADREAGNEIISLLQKEKEVPGFNVDVELEVFDLAVLKLGIKSDKAVLAEKRALRRLLSKTRKEEDKKKELIVLYLLHLLRRYSKFYKLELGEDGLAADVTSSCPPSPSERGSEASTSGQDSDFSSELCFFGVYHKRSVTGIKEGLSCLRHSFIPPEEFRCPISLQLMADPVIISSGQTYERVCIEKWFGEGHDTCPKTQQKLAHLDVTPNYCVKGLITSWCERHGVPIPTPPSPPPSVVTNWNHVPFYESVAVKPLQPTPTEARPGTPRTPRIAAMDSSLEDICSRAVHRVVDEEESLHRSAELLYATSLDLQLTAVEEIRRSAKDNADARLYIGQAGLIPALIGFLGAAVRAEDSNAIETACFALLNVAINNNRNKAEMVDAGAIPLLLKIIDSDKSLTVREAAIAVFLTASCLDENKPAIGSSGVVYFLVNHLETGTSQGIKDALTTLFNLSIFAGNYTHLVKEDAIPKILQLLSLGDIELIEKCLTILYNLSCMEEARKDMAETNGGISALAEILYSGSQKEKELVVGIFLALAINDYDHSQIVLSEGVIPSLVMVSIHGSTRGKEKAQKLLQHFREERQNDSTSQVLPSLSASSNGGDREGKLERGFFRRKTLFFRKSKSFSFYHC